MLMLDVRRLRVLSEVARARVVLRRRRGPRVHAVRRLPADRRARTRGRHDARGAQRARGDADRRRPCARRATRTRSSPGSPTPRRSCRRSPALRGGRLRLTAFPSACATLMPLAIARFRERHPGVELTLEPARAAGGVAGAARRRGRHRPDHRGAVRQPARRRDRAPPAARRPDVRRAAGRPPARREAAGCASRTSPTRRGWSGPPATCPDAADLPARVRQPPGSSRGSPSSSTTTSRSRASSPRAMGVSFIPDLALVAVRDDVVVRPLGVAAAGAAHHRRRRSPAPTARRRRRRCSRCCSEVAAEFDAERRDARAGLLTRDGPHRRPLVARLRPLRRAAARRRRGAGLRRPPLAAVPAPPALRRGGAGRRALAARDRLRAPGRAGRAPRAASRVRERRLGGGGVPRLRRPPAHAGVRGRGRAPRGAGGVPADRRDVRRGPVERCHRRLLADVLVLRGAHVVHLLPEGGTTEHALTGFAVRGEDGLPRYPAPQLGSQTTGAESSPRPSAAIASVSPGCSQRGSVAEGAVRVELEQAAAVQRPGAEDVARAQARVAGGVREELRPGPVHLGRRRSVSCSPLSVARAASCRRPSRVGQLVGRDEPRAEATSRSPCPWPGRGRRSSRARWMSRALQSLRSVKPAISPSSPMTAATSSSKSSHSQPAGRRTGSPGPWIDAGLEK